MRTNHRAATRALLFLPLLALLPTTLAPAAAQTLTYDFDTGAPPLFRGQGLSFSQTVGGIAATFSSPQGNAFSLQNDGSTFFRLSQFSGLYLLPSSVFRNTLDIHFSVPLTYISLTFCTVDYQDNAEIPANLQVTAYTNGGSIVGTASKHGEYLGDTYPMGQLTFDSAGVPFDWVHLVVPPQPQGTTNFLTDNITVSTVPASGAGSVPDGRFVAGQELTVSRDLQGDIVLFWGLSCRPGDTDYEVYEGQLGNYPSHAPVRCGTGGATFATIFATPGNRYYLVAPRSAGVEGSLGKDSNGLERSVSPTPCLPQSLAGCP